MASAGIRAPNPKYNRRNGFEEYTNQLPNESLKEAEATEAQDISRFVIREMGSFFPSLAEMKEETDALETVATISQAIKRLKKENHDNLAKLSRYYAQELYDDALDRYCQTDDIKYHDFEDFSKSATRDEWAGHYARLENYFKQNDKIVLSEHNDLVARMQYDHLRDLVRLYSQRRELERKEDPSRYTAHPSNRRMTQHNSFKFPQSIWDYRKLSVIKDAQLQVARYLMAKDLTNRENIRVQCQWTLQETEPLMREYKNTATFRSEIEALASHPAKV